MPDIICSRPRVLKIFLVIIFGITLLTPEIAQSAITGSVTDVTASPYAGVLPGGEISVFSFSLTTSATVPVTLTNVPVIINDVSNIATTDFSSLQVVDSGGNHVGAAAVGAIGAQINISCTQFNTIATTASIFYLIAHISNNATFGAIFNVNIPNVDLGIAGDTPIPLPATSRDIVISGRVTPITDVRDIDHPQYPSLYYLLPYNSGPNGIFDIKLNAPLPVGVNDTGAKLQSIQILFTDVGGANFTYPTGAIDFGNGFVSIDGDISILSNSISETQWGVGLYKDDGNRDDYWDADDQFLKPNSNFLVSTSTGNGVGGTVGIILYFDDVYLDAAVQDKNDVADPDKVDVDDYILVIRTSQKFAGNGVGVGDEFGVTVVNISTSNGSGEAGDITDTIYEIISPIAFSTISSRINTLIGYPSSAVNDNIALDFLPERVFFMDIAGGLSILGVPLTLQDITMEFIGNSFEISDLQSIQDDDFSGVTLFWNGGSDRRSIEFSDSRVSIASTNADFIQGLGVGNIEDTLLLVPRNALNVPNGNRDDDSSYNGVGVEGFDFFTGIQTSKTINYNDSFYVRVPPGGINISGVGSNASVTADTSGSITSNPPTFFTDLISGGIVANVPRKGYAVFGINVNDSEPFGGLGTAIASIYMYFFPIGTTDSAAISSAISSTTTGDSSTGIALYKDNDGAPNNTNGAFDENVDTFVNYNLGKSGLVGAPYMPYQGTLYYQYVVDTTGDSSIPDDDAGANSGDDFFLVIRMSDIASNGKQFYVLIQDSATLNFTDGVSRYFQSITGSPNAHITQSFRSSAIFINFNLLQLWSPVNNVVTDTLTNNRFFVNDAVLDPFFDAVDDDTYFLSVTTPATDTTIINANSSISQDIGGLNTQLDNTLVEIVLFNPNYQVYPIPDGMTITIEIAYPDADDNGIVDGTDISVTSLKIYRLDETNERWVTTDSKGSAINSVVDLINKRVSATVTSLSIFRLFGIASQTTLDDVMVYPNPFRPNDGNIATGSVGGGIIFANLTNGSHLRLFSLNGREIYSEQDITSGATIWRDVDNDGGVVPSGVYYYLITDPRGNVAKGKVMVIR